jgi:hypothetical protein
MVPMIAPLAKGHYEKVKYRHREDIPIYRDDEALSTPDNTMWFTI